MVVLSVPADPMSAPRLILIVPGLFTPPIESDRNLIRLRAPALQWVVGRGRVVSHNEDSVESVVLAVGGQSTQSPPPAGAICRAFDTGNISSECCMRADPVPLRLTRFGLSVDDPRLLALQPDEIQRLAQALAPVFESRSLQLETPNSLRWYVSGEIPGNGHPSSAERSFGDSVDPCPPTSEQRSWWQQLVTETQMALHGSPVNTEREERGLSVVNNLWYWGSGRFDPASRVDGLSVWGDDAFELGLGRWLGIPAEPLPDNASNVLSRASDRSSVLVVDRSYRHAGDSVSANNWCDRIGRFERAWCSPLLAELRYARLSSLAIIDPGRVQAMIDQTTRKRWWRRPVRVDNLINQINKSV
ncbi:MAG: hypothetical protein OEQ39_02010 [Gammaproteobacteria bacterium]|nr:hypothetical protein [Gammaproteobacteria bacterium]